MYIPLTFTIIQQKLSYIVKNNAWIGVRKAVDCFFKDKLELPVPMPDKSGSILIIKQ